MRRRLVVAVLALLGAVALAGCADAAGSISMEPVDDTALAERASEETSGAGHYPAISRQRTARQIIRNGTLNVTDSRPPLRPSLPYEYRGAYYTLSYEAVDSRPGVETLVHVDYNDSDPSENATRVAFADLPPVDRERLRPMFNHDPSFRRPGPEGERTLTYDEQERRRSTLLATAGGQLVVSYRGDDYTVLVRGPREETLTTYRYDTSMVADSSRAYAQQLTERYAFPLSNLDANETAVVEAALDDSYYAESTDDAGFDALVDRFRAHPAVEADEYSGTWIVRYEGQRYWVEMEYGPFVDGTGAGVTPPSVTPH